MQKIKKLVALLLLCTFFTFSSMPLTPFERGDHQAAHAVMPGSGYGYGLRQEAPTILLEFGSTSDDDIKDLRDSKGKIYKRIAEVIEKLKESGETPEDAQLVIAVVVRK